MSRSLREARWLMHAGTGQDDPAALAALAAPGLDFTRLLAIAEFERGFPVVADRLRDAAIVMPPEIAAAVRSRALMAEFAIGRLHAALDEVVGILAGAGVRVLLLKGAALSRTRYARRRLRPMGDLDLLIEPSAAERARALLMEAGWQTRHDPHLDDFYGEHHHLAPMYDPRGAGAKLELHVDLCFRGNPFRFGAADVWRKAVPTQVGASGAWVPSAEHLLLHSCIHFAWGHLMREGAWTTCRDVALLAGAADLDWDAFTTQARDARAATASYWTLRLAARLMRAPVPAEVLRRLAPSRHAAWLDRFERHFVSRILGAKRAPRGLEHAIWEFAMEPGSSGHGSVRPWDRDEEYIRSAVGAAAPTESVSSRARHLLQNLRDTARCLGDLASSRPDPV